MKANGASIHAAPSAPANRASWYRTGLTGSSATSPLWIRNDARKSTLPSGRRHTLVHSDNPYLS